MPFCVICGKESEALDSHNICDECRALQKLKNQGYSSIEERTEIRQKKRKAILRKLPIIIIIISVVFFLGLLAYNYLTDPVHDRELKRKAKSKDVESMYELGILYQKHALQSEKSRKKASYWLYQTGVSGDPRGYYELGKMEMNIGDEFNISWAFTHFTNAAEMDYAPAQMAVAYCYYEGLGVYQDNVQALKWFLIAESNEEGIVENEIYYLTNIMSQESINIAYKEAEWEMNKKSMGY